MSLEYEPAAEPLHISVNHLLVVQRHRHLLAHDARYHLPIKYRVASILKLTNDDV